MARWALEVGGVAHEITDADPDGRFAPDMPWHPCGPDTAVGDQWVGGVWTRPGTPAPTLADRRAALAAERYARESAGVMFTGAGGTAVLAASDATSQAKLGNAYQLARDGFWVAGTPWKMADGSFAPLTADDRWRRTDPCVRPYDDRAPLSRQSAACTAPTKRSSRPRSRPTWRRTSPPAGRATHERRPHPGAD